MAEPADRQDKFIDLSAHVEEQVEVRDAIRVKVAYEAAIRDSTGRRSVFFTIDPNSRTGPGNLTSFKRINRKLKSMNVSVGDFMGVMFTHYHWPRKIGSRVFQYPYLTFIASDGGMLMFRRGAHAMKECYQTVRSMRSVIKSADSLEVRFSNCFYTGFGLLYAACEATGFKYFERPINVATFFFAYKEVFSPEFILLHRSFRKASKLPRRGVEKRLFLVISQYVSKVRKRALYDEQYRLRLGRAYRAVRDREMRDVEKLSVHRKDWRKVWMILA